MYLKQQFLFFIFLFAACFCRAQNFPGIQWNKCFGGTDLDYLMDIQQTFDGGYITAGFTYSQDGDVTNYRDSGDCWIVKLKPSGDIEWQRTFGGNGYDAAWSVQQTKDSGYIIGGNSLSTDGDISVNQGEVDFCVIKLDKQGHLEWQHSYGGSREDYIRSIIQTSDGGYFVAGNTRSNDGDVSGNNGESDFWLIKTDSIGDLLWQKCLGGQWNDHCNAAIQTKDGGFAVTGALDLNFPFITLSYTIKIDSAGNVEWELPVYDMWMEECNQIMQTIDGGYILPGSYRGPISNNSYYKKAHLLKLNANGTIEWRKRFTTGILSIFLSIAPSGDSGYIAGGWQMVENAGVSNSNCWIVETDVNGNMIGEKQMGGQDQDATMKVRQTRDGNFVLANTTWSTDGDVVGNHGRIDYWVVKFGPIFSLSLSSFTAKRNCEETELVWQTRSEISTAFFEIQRSNDGNNFETINTVNAAGGIAAMHTYQYNDNTPFEGRNYYRLKTVSTYGTFEYSELKTVNIARKKSYLLPNPVVSVMTIIPKCNLRLVQLFSADGKLVRNLPVAENDQYNISNLPSAKYFLRLVYDKGAEVLQLIKL